MNNRIVTSLCVLCAILGAIIKASAQGPLTPPGAPAPTMKSLSQVEPRTPITNTTAVTINAPGSYYLTANISVTNGTAISITVSDVTLDLNGFTLSSTEASPTGNGILLGGSSQDITIFNGHIKGNVSYNAGSYTGSGFYNGISSLGSPFNTRVSGVSVSGCLNYGIYLGENIATVVESCTVQTVGIHGIIADSVSHSIANQCGGIGIRANTADNCYAFSTGDTGLLATGANNCYGFSTGFESAGLLASTANNCNGFGTPGLFATTANNCQGISDSGDGLDAETANNCQGSSGSGIGLFASQIAIGCYGSSTSGTGIRANILNSCVGTSYLFNNKYNMP